MTTKAIIFDMDGVLVDTHNLHSITLKAAVQKFGYNWIEPKEGCTKTSLQKLKEMNIFGKNAEDIYECKKQIYTEMLPEYICLRPELYSLIDECRDLGFRVAVCSNSSTNAVISGLHLANLNNLFHEHNIIANDSAPGLRGKPEPDLYRYTCQMLYVKPEEAIVFEDSEDGVQAAISAYCNVIHVSYDTLPSKLDNFLIEYRTKRKVA